jgi:hypothetical protein
MALQTKASPRLRFALEILFSINIAFAGITLLFGSNPTISLLFAHLEVYINHLLGIRQTDFIRGYFECWIPSLLLALGIWIVLHVFQRTKITSELLKSVAAGAAIAICPSAIWIYAYERNGWSLDWPYKNILGELLLALICIWLFVNLRWAAARWIGAVSIVGHCLFWYWFTGGRFYGFEWGIPGYTGPYGFIVGTSAMAVWGMYVRAVRTTCDNGNTVTASCC